MNDPLWDLIVGIFDVGGLKITMVTKSNYSTFNAVSSFRKHANIIIIQPWMCKTHFIFYGISLGSQISNFQNCGLLNLNKALHFYAFLIVTLCKLKYSRVHFSSDKAFYKILKKPSILGFSKNFCFLFFPNENQLGFHMRYGFSRNLQKTSFQLWCTRL